MTRTTADAGWWVVALGGVYDPENFDQRETVRTRLRQELLLVAIVPDIYVWVRDEKRPLSARAAGVFRPAGRGRLCRGPVRTGA